MTVYVKVLVPAKTVENTQTVQYVSQNIITVIDKFTATNYGAVAATISVNIVTAGDTPNNSNLISKSKTLRANETYLFPELVGQVISMNGFISTIADTANSINIRSSGREVIQ
jgi:hypothetical protein